MLRPLEKMRLRSFSRLQRDEKFGQPRRFTSFLMWYFKHIEFYPYISIILIIISVKLILGIVPSPWLVCGFWCFPCYQVCVFLSSADGRGVGFEGILYDILMMISYL